MTENDESHPLIPSHTKEKDTKDTSGTKPKPKKATGAQFSPAAVTLQKTIAAITKATTSKTSSGLKRYDAPLTTLPHVSTGSSTLDILIGGTLAADGKPLCPGFPRRRITEVYGPESSGKTTLLLSSIARLQRAGGCALFVDFEHHISKKYAMDIGVQWDTGTFDVIQPRTLEEGLKAIYLSLMTGVDLVGVDSVAAMIPSAEMKKKFDDPVKIGAVAAAFSTVLPKFGVWFDEFPRVNEKKLEGHPGTAVVLLNQTRALISTSGGGHGDQENTSGGKAMKFYSTMRIRMSRIKSLTLKRKDPMSGREVNVPYGNLTHVKIVKSKLDAKQGATAQVFIRYGFGIDDYFSIIEAGVQNKLLKLDGSWYILNGERHQGKDKLRKFLIANPKAFEDLKAKIMSLVIAGSKPIDPDEELTETDEMIETMTKDLGGELDGDDDEESSDEPVVEEEVEGGGEGESE
jgi:recombination protein RecA